MEDQPSTDGHQQPQEESTASTQLREGREFVGDQEHEASLDPADVEVDSLKRRLELYHKELDALHEQVAAIRREGQALAGSIRREAQEKALEIIRRATVEAELLELRARVRAEEMQAMEAARLWARQYGSPRTAEAGMEAAALDQLSRLPADYGERGPIDGDEMAGTAVEAGTSPAAAEGSRPDEEKPAITEAHADLAAPVARAASAGESVIESSRHDDQPALAGDEGEMAEETGQAETSEADSERDQPGEEEAEGTEAGSGHAAIYLMEGESDGDPAQPSSAGVRQYRVRGPVTSGSVVAIEQAVGRMAGVVAARVRLSPDGGAVLAVSSDDPRSTDLAIRRLGIQSHL